jgi:tetratricopeptide (TPR) repeat protein
MVSEMRNWMLLSLLAGCATTARAPILVPPEAVREWAYTPDGQTGPGRYVVRMSDGRREWEVEFPDAAYGSEVRVPLKNGGRELKLSADAPGLTAADRELEADRAAHERAPELSEPYSLLDQPRRGDKKHKASYLLGLEQVKELYKTKNYRQALVYATELEKDYPNDEKLLAMKGSLYHTLGKNRLAREAWERVLALNPDDSVTAAKLRELAEEEERGKAKRPSESDAD